MTEHYQTGDEVPATGMYICQLNGLEKSFKSGETFDLCPESWKNTTWVKKKEE